MLNILSAWLPCTWFSLTARALREGFFFPENVIGAQKVCNELVSISDIKLYFTRKKANVCGLLKLNIISLWKTLKYLPPVKHLTGVVIQTCSHLAASFSKSFCKALDKSWNFFTFDSHLFFCVYSYFQALTSHSQWPGAWFEYSYFMTWCLSRHYGDYFSQAVQEGYGYSGDNILKPLGMWGEKTRLWQINHGSGMVRVRQQVRGRLLLRLIKVKFWHWYPWPAVHRWEKRFKLLSQDLTCHSLHSFSCEQPSATLNVFLQRLSERRTLLSTFWPKSLSSNP